MNLFHSLFLFSLYVLVAAFSPQSCTKGAVKTSVGKLITKVSYSTTGGRSGNYESLAVSADSVFYLEARRGAEKVFRQKTIRKEWEELIHAINLDDFGKVRSHPGHALYDGIDVTVLIESGDEKYSIVNGEEDSVNYGKIKPFVELLQKKASELRTKISR